MPIGNTYLSEWHTVRAAFPSDLVNYPEGNDFLTSLDVIQTGSRLVTTPPGTQTVDLAFKRFDQKMESDARPVELVQGFPLSKAYDVGVGTWTYDIEVPVILAPATSEGESYRIRANEILFWLSWITYMFSSFDRIGGSDQRSAIVEQATVQVDTNGVSLGLTIRTNFNMGWHNQRDLPTTASGVNRKVIGRPAGNYDCFLKFENYSSPSPLSFSGAGLENVWGVNSFQSQASSSFETLVTTPFTDNSILTGQSLLADQLNVKMVSVNGQLDTFGDVDGWSLDYNNLSKQSSGEFTTAITDTDGTSSISKYEDVINSNMEKGYFQLYIGAYDGDDASGISAIPLLMLPTGMFVNSAQISASSGPISIRRGFSGVITDEPIMSSIGPNALLSQEG